MERFNTVMMQQDTVRNVQSVLDLSHDLARVGTITVHVYQWFSSWFFKTVMFVSPIWFSCLSYLIRENL